MTEDTSTEVITIVEVKWEKRQYPYLRVKADNGKYYTVDKHSLWDMCGVGAKLTVQILQKGKITKIENAIVIEAGQPLPPQPAEGGEAPASQASSTRPEDDTHIVRESALRSAVLLANAMISSGKPIDSVKVLQAATLFEKYILTGEVPAERRTAEGHAHNGHAAPGETTMSGVN